MEFLVAVGEARTRVPAIIALAQWEITPEHLRAGNPSGAFIVYRELAPGVRGNPLLFRPVRDEQP